MVCTHLSWGSPAWRGPYGLQPTALQMPLHRRGMIYWVTTPCVPSAATSCSVPSELLALNCCLKCSSIHGLWLAGLHGRDGSFNLIKGRQKIFFSWCFQLQRALIFKHSVVGESTCFRGRKTCTLLLAVCPWAHHLTSLRSLFPSL